MKTLHDIDPEQLLVFASQRLNIIMELKQRPGLENLFFSGTYGEHPPLDLCFDPPLVATGLIFSLPDQEQLALGKIELLTADGRQPEISRGPNNSHPTTSGLPDVNIALPQDTHTTAPGSPAKIYLEFTEPTSLVGLRLCNRQRNLWRNHSLLIEYTSKQMANQQIFSHQALFDDFMTALIASRSSHTTDPGLSAALARLDTILLTLIYDACPKDLTDLNLEDIALLTKLKHLTSQKIFFPRQLEITTHGITRSFRFWSESELLDYLQDACDILQALEPLSPYCCFGYGSVLGFVREPSGHIPHDTDHDLMIFFPEQDGSSFASAATLIEQHLGPKGFDLPGRDPNMQCTKVTGPRSQKILDIFPGFYDSQGQARIHPAFLGKYLTLDMLFPAVTSTILGTKCYIPKKNSDYLNVTFGKYWRIPLNTCFTAEHNKMTYSR